FHVNGDDPEAVLFVSRLAFDYRQKFKRDVVIDLVCYRRHGHNEADEPSATQPLMYKIIRARPTLRELYGKQLIADGVLDAAGAQAMSDDYRKLLEAGAPIAGVDTDFHDPHAVDWSKHLAADVFEKVNSGVAEDEMSKVVKQLLNVPAEMT